MNDDIFGTVTFDNGWIKDKSISLWGKEFKILVMATAYYEHETITDEQRTAYNAFLNKRKSLMNKIEKLLDDYMEEPEKRLCPRFLVFEKNGKYALLFDDVKEPDDGVAVQLSPIEKVMSQDAYL